MDDLTKQPYKIVVAGTGYVGMSLAVLLAQYNHVVAVDIVKERVWKFTERNGFPLGTRRLKKLSGFP